MEANDNEGCRTFPEKDTDTITNDRNTTDGDVNMEEFLGTAVP